MRDADPGTYIRQLTGQPVARQANGARCTACGTRLGAGSAVTAYAYRFSDDPRLRVARLYCEACADRAIRHPTLGAAEAVVAASLRTCHGRLVLSDIEVCDWSRTAEGEDD